jgi:crotonobetainyl-CoA:carnitine CoA-transferase CaiB-like acyl-CoA transferase
MEHELVSGRLQAALDERDRLSRRYEEAVGTTSELSAYARLQAANLAVTNADRLVRVVERPASGSAP